MITAFSKRTTVYEVEVTSIFTIFRWLIKHFHSYLCDFFCFKAFLVHQFRSKHFWVRVLNMTKKFCSVISVSSFSSDFRLNVFFITQNIKQWLQGSETFVDKSTVINTIKSGSNQIYKGYQYFKYRRKQSNLWYEMQINEL